MPIPVTSKDKHLTDRKVQSPRTLGINTGSCRPSGVEMHFTRQQRRGREGGGERACTPDDVTDLD